MDFDETWEHKQALKYHVNTFKNKTVSLFKTVILPMILQAVVIFMVSQLFALPAFAKGKKGRKGGKKMKGKRIAVSPPAEASSTALTSTMTDSMIDSAPAVVDTVVKVAKRGKGRKFKRFVKKVLEGANAEGKAFNMKAGDTRTEIAALLNSFSSIIILSVLFFGAFLKQKQREIRQESLMVKELNRVTEYKENMYFDAVEEILEKLKEPKLKGSTKASLMRQLKDLDPKGTIKKFIEEKGPRPDISDLVKREKRTKKKRVSDAKKKRVKKPKKDVDMDYSDDVEDVSVPSDKPPVTTSSVGKSSKEEDPALLLLNDLWDSLEGIIASKERKLLLEHLKARLDSISDQGKRQGVMNKIRERLGNAEYWTSYVDKL
jgi:hypothetical protein